MVRSKKPALKAKVAEISTNVSHESQMLSLRKESSFGITMNSIQKEMGPLSRHFSRFIHIGPVEVTSDIISRSLARPTALLIGSIVSFFGLFSLYLTARDSGFALRGSEFYILFAAGWIVGIVIDLGRILLGKTRADV